MIALHVLRNSQDQYDDCYDFCIQILDVPRRILACGSVLLVQLFIQRGNTEAF